MPMTVLICGSPASGVQIIGLFANSADAQCYAKDYSLKDWRVVDVISPAAFVAAWPTAMDRSLVRAAQFWASAALFVGTHPTVTTRKAGKAPRFLRFTELGGKCGVGELVMTRRPAGRGSSRPVGNPHGGPGRLRDPRLA
jgi:hypothetical protein